MSVVIEFIRKNPLGVLSVIVFLSVVIRVSADWVVLNALSFGLLVVGVGVVGVISLRDRVGFGDDSK